jgi:hypothetical protein
VDFVAGDGVRLRNGPLAVGYYDPVDGRNVILGTIRDTAGEPTAPNEVTYRSAFDGIDASIRITYRRAGMSADLILNELPADPTAFGLSDHARLEINRSKQRERRAEKNGHSRADLSRRRGFEDRSCFFVGFVSFCKIECRRVAPASASSEAGPAQASPGSPRRITGLGSRHQANHLNWDSGSGPSSTTYLTNCLFVVTNAGAYTGANNASNTSSSVFSVVGAGAHYLADATYPGLGTTNLNTNLLAEIRSRTTQPPLTITNGFLAADTTLNPRSALRYTNNAFPDLGFHYPILDHVLGLVAMTNVQLSINPGAAVGLAIAEPGNYALMLADGAKLLVEGSPTNLARLIRPHLVQEQANNAWKNHGFSLVLPWWTANPAPSVSLRFAQVATVYDEILIGYSQPANVSFRDSQFHGGTFYNLSTGFGSYRFWIPQRGRSAGANAVVNNGHFAGGWPACSRLVRRQRALPVAKRDQRGQRPVAKRRRTHHRHRRHQRRFRHGLLSHSKPAQSAVTRCSFTLPPMPATQRG